MSMEQVVIVGAGPAGCLLAHYLLRRGYRVQLFEKRHSTKHGLIRSVNLAEQVDSGLDRSYTMMLLLRAIDALAGAEIQLPASILRTMKSVVAYLPNGVKMDYPFPSDPELKLVTYGTNRKKFVEYLQQVLLERKYEGLSSIQFGWELVAISDDQRTATFRQAERLQSSIDAELSDDKQVEGKEMKVSFDFLIGADGASSIVRTEMLRLGKPQSQAGSSKSLPISIETVKHPFPYKTVHVRPEMARLSKLFKHKEAVQVWPELDILLTTMADDSFWGRTRMPELVSATKPEQIEQAFRSRAPELWETVQEANPEFCEDFVKQPPRIYGAATYLSRFHHGNILLVGDAAHTMFPTYGVACNVALEDCALFDTILGELQSSGNLSLILAAEEFSRRRVKDAHAIVRLNVKATMKLRQTNPALKYWIVRKMTSFLTPLQQNPMDLHWQKVPWREVEMAHKRYKMLTRSVITLPLLALGIAALGVTLKLVMLLRSY